MSEIHLAMPDQWLRDISEVVLVRIEDDRRWVTSEGLCAWLGCEKDHIYDLREKGLPARRIPDKDGRLSKKLYFSLREVSDWFEAVGLEV
ncbi:MAG TPA: hypothetical protein VGO31_16270 [Microbacteriaceae bacterium]|nr:hypothetical protein [Microbacteriaceae bacterium]